MSDEHTHCWHSHGRWTDSTGDHESRKCCHCGQWEQIDVKPLPPFDSGKWEQPKHGPHSPITRITW